MRGLLLLLLALLLRLATFNGALGSDDLVYFGRAVDLARGEWTSANYNGALRYGFNLPAAAFIALFGENLFAANLWPLIASLLEIAAVYVFAESVMNRRAALFSALLLATAPLHIAVASRIHADAVVSMFLTLAFVLLYFGAMRRHAGLLFASGLAIGGVFWTKELALVTWFAILPMVWLFRGSWRLCIWPLSGTLLMVLLHLGLMDFIAGDPLHLVKVVTRAVQKNFVAGGQGEDGAAYYLKFLFFDIRHTGFLGFFAILSIGLVPAWLHREGRSSLGFGVALLWWIGLLAVLSLFPVSLSPLRLTMKQSNYITLFLAPMALLAGMAVAAMPPIAYRLALALSLSIGSLLGVLQQADYRAYTANSKAVAAFSAAHPNSLVIGSANNSACVTAKPMRTPCTSCWTDRPCPEVRPSPRPRMRWLAGRMSRRWCRRTSVGATGWWHQPPRPWIRSNRWPMPWTDWHGRNKRMSTRSWAQTSCVAQTEDSPEPVSWLSPGNVGNGTTGCLCRGHSSWHLT